MQYILIGLKSLYCKASLTLGTGIICVNFQASGKT